MDYDDLQITLLGHASVRIETGDGTVIYLDPWHSVVAGEPGDGDLVLVTHDDADHYDPEGIEAVAGPDVTVAVYEAIDTGDLDVDVVELAYDGETTVDGIGVRSIPAYNDPDGERVDDDGTPFHPPGEGIGLLLTIGDTTVLYPSDTDFLEHHEALTAAVFIPPIGGHYTMDRHDAAAFARHLEPELVLPVHYDTFEAIETDVGAFADELREGGIDIELG